MPLQGGETQQVRMGKTSGHVGFDSLPDQLVNKEAANGFTFNILCVGETGIGKSTLMNSLFNSKFDSSPSNHDLPIVKLRPNTYELKEGNIKLRLTVIETSGYGDQVRIALPAIKQYNLVLIARSDGESFLLVALLTTYTLL